MKKPFLFLWIIIIALLVFFWVYLPALSRYHDLRTRQEEIDHQIGKLDEKIKSIKEERDLLKHDSDYLEKVIREELGLVKPGEVVYKFVTEKLGAGKSDDVKKEEAVAKISVPVPPEDQVLPMPSVSGAPAETPKKGNASKPAVAKSSEPVYPRVETR